MPKKNKAKSTIKSRKSRFSELLPHKKISWLSALFVVVIVAGIGTKLLFFSRASAPPQIGSQFHCTWTSYNNTQRAAVLDKLAAAKIGWVRIDFGWSAFQEQSRDTYSQWYIDLSDYCVNQALARGIKVLAMVHRTPAWANGGQDTGTPPTDLNDFANFAYWMANHFKGRIAAYEVWNEPDPTQSFWTGTVNQYADMLKLAYPKFKAGDPSAKVVLGAPTYNNADWIGQIYSLGAKDSFDIMATHPYQGQANQPPEYPGDSHHWWFSKFPGVLKVMQQYGDGNKEVWFTEFGWSSHDNTAGLPEWQKGVTLEQQGDYFIRAIKYTQANYPNVTNMFWYNERNRTNTDIQNANYGLLYNDLTEKPVYFAIKNYLSSLVSGSPDATTPTVSVTAPANGATISGTVNVSANANDNIGVARVEFYVGGVLKATVTSAPYTFNWDTTTSPNGVQGLQAKAFDGAGNSGNSTVVNVNVSNAVPGDTTAPVVRISKPVNGATVSGVVKIAATATDNAAIRSMEIEIDGRVVSTSSSGSINASWNTRKAAAGPHTITVRAVDTSGNIGILTITVTK